MYSGTTLTPLSGRILGAHQKIDRLARASLRQLLQDDRLFPRVQQILHFEGVNGPDAIKRKSPAKDEPWHYYSPFDDADNQLPSLISAHYETLVVALHANDSVRASFEAAWLAHAIVDGLTPAHHYPYEEKLTELRGGKGIETRDSIRGKLIMPGTSPGHALRNNWKMWGPKGLLTTHGFFEFGVAAVIAPMGHRYMAPLSTDLSELQEHGVLELFRLRAKEIANLGMYEEYYRTGWTPRLARQVRRTLIPTIVRTVTLIWYAAAIEAGLERRKT